MSCAKYVNIYIKFKSNGDYKLKERLLDWKKAIILMNKIYVNLNEQIGV